MDNSKASLERLDDGHARFHGCSRIQDYEFISKLGEGTFGEVSKAKSKKTGHVVALKKILMHNEKDGFPITALREIKLLKQLNHINILKLEEMAIERSRDVKKKPSMFMVTPYMDHDLSGLLENPAVHFFEGQIKCYMKQLLEGCEYLHANKILHRDMKAANLLINNRGILQIADFGLARPYDDEVPKPGQGGGEAKREYTTLVVTRWYRPPELLLQLRRYTTAIDMWGVGCVFGEMFKGKPILAGNSDLNQAHLIFDLVGSPTDENMPGWSELPGCEGVKDFSRRMPTIDTVFREQHPLAVSLLKELLMLDWRKRINAIDALKHPYFHSHPLPARPEELPAFEESHELDRRKFRDQKARPPPAPAGGSVGIASRGDWQPDWNPRQPFAQSFNAYDRGRSRVPYSNSQSASSSSNYRGPGRQNGDHANNSRMYPNAQRENEPPPYDSNYHPPSHHAKGPNSTALPTGTYNNDKLPRRPPPQDLSLPPRPPPVSDSHSQPQHGHNQRSPYRDDSRGAPPLPRSRVPPPGPHRNGPAAEVDTYIPSYSSANPNARPPANVLSSGRGGPNWDRDDTRDRERDRDRDRDRDGDRDREPVPYHRRRDDLPIRDDARRNEPPPPPRDEYRRNESPPIDYGDAPARYDDSRGMGMSIRGAAGGSNRAGYDRRRSRSPRRDWERGPARNEGRYQR